MPVTLRDVEQIASLARLEFSPEEKEKLTHQLNQILAYMEQLNRLDTSTVEPLSHVVETGNVFRQDELRPGVATEEALKNAPAAKGDFFSVPKVIGDKE